MKLEVIPIDKAKEYLKWVEFRNSGLGGSEVATVMGFNQWKCAHEVYYQKIGSFDQMKKQNIAMFMGNYLEPAVAELYSYWGGSEESMIENFTAGLRLRNLYEIKGYVINPRFPHLFFSPDRLDLKDFDHGKKFVVRKNALFTEHINEIVEIKTISGFALKQYDDEFNPAYGIQLSTYLMGLGIKTGRLVTMKDGRNFLEQTIELDDDIAWQIENQTTEFWERVEKGREEVMNGGTGDQYAPPPDGSKAYEAFLKEKYKDPEEKTISQPPREIYLAAVEHKKAQEVQKEAENDTRLQKNILVNFMGNMSQIDFGEYGKVTYRPDKNGTRRLVNLVRDESGQPI